MTPSTVTGRASIINKGWRINIMRVTLGGLALLLLPLGACRAGPVFQQTNLVSSVFGLAPVTDPNLKNPWGVSFAPSGAFSVSNQVTGTANQYDSNGTPRRRSSPSCRPPAAALLDVPEPTSTSNLRLLRR
jgi:hypothetical protein